MRTAKALTLCLVLILAAALPAAFAAETLAGSVVDSAGRPVASVWVVARSGNAEQGRSLTGDDGSFYLGNLAAGDYVVQVKRGDTVLFTGGVRLPRNGDYAIRLP